MTESSTKRTSTSRLPGILAASRVPRLLGGLTYLIGVIDVLTGLLHTWRVRLQGLTEVLPGALSDAAAAATVVSGIFLIVLGHSLKRRKRRAWRAAVALLGLSVVLHAVKLEPVAAVVAAVALALLIRYRDEFHALGDPTTRWRAVRAFIVLLGVSVLAGLLVLWLSRREIVGGWPPLPDLLREIGYGMLGLDGPLQYTRDRTADVVGSMLLALGLMTLLTPVYLALRPPEPRPELTEDDDVRLRALMERHSDSLAYFNTRHDKSVIWSQSGKAAVCYRVVSGVMLASGDPLGDPEAWPGAIRAFLEEAGDHAWTPAVLGCSERAGTVWVRETGFSALELGDEAVVDTHAFTLEGRPMRNVRQMVGRISRAGYVGCCLRARAFPLIDASSTCPEGAATSGSYCRSRGKGSFESPPTS